MIYYIGTEIPTEETTNAAGVVDSEPIESCSFEYMLNVLKDLTYIQVDTETIENRVYLIQFGNYDNQFVLEWKKLTIKQKGIIKSILEGTTKTKLLQNAKFDYKVMLHEDIRIQNIFDTFLAEQVIHCGKNLIEMSLYSLCLKYCNVTLDKSIRGDIEKVGITRAVIRYAARDVKYLEIIMRGQMNDITTLELERTMELENNVVKAFAEMEFNGIAINTSEWLELNTQAKKDVDAFKLSLDSDLLSIPSMKEHLAKSNKAIQFGLFEEYKIDLNYNSSKQVTQIFKALGAVYNLRQLKEITGVAEKEVEKFKQKVPFIAKYLDFKEKKTELSKYGLKFIQENVTPSGRVHTEFWQIKNTGRVSSNKPNLQNLPRDTQHRNCFKADAGYLIADVDYSSQELALIAEDSNEQIWIDSVNNGWDLHSTVAELTFKDWKANAEPDCEYYKSKQKCKCKKHKEQREKIKTINYALSYGAKAPKIATSLNITVKEAETLITSYFAQTKRLEQHFKTLAAYGTTYLYIRSFKPYRRVRHFEIPPSSKEYAEIERQSMNTRFQATGADMCKQALVNIYNYIHQNNLWDKVKFMLQVHDSIMMQVVEDYAEEWLEIQKRLMVQVNEGMLFKVVVGVDGQLTKYWKK